MKPGTTRGWRRTVGENAVCKAGGEFERSCAERIASPRAIRVPSLCFTPCTLPLPIYLFLSSSLSLSHTYTHTYSRARACAYIHSYSRIPLHGDAPLRARATHTHTHSHIYICFSRNSRCARQGRKHTHSRASLPLTIPTQPFQPCDTRARGDNRVSSRESAVRWW